MSADTVGVPQLQSACEVQEWWWLAERFRGSGRNSGQDPGLRCYQKTRDDAPFPRPVNFIRIEITGSVTPNLSAGRAVTHCPRIYFSEGGTTLLVLEKTISYVPGTVTLTTLRTIYDLVPF